MKRALVLSPILFAACASSTSSVATLVGEPTGVATTQLIGATGGTITSPNGDLRIQVPAGAVSGDITFSLTPITSKATGAFGQAWRLGPEGTTFATAVTISFKYSGAMLNGAAPESILVASQNSDRTWTRSTPVLDKTASTVSLGSKHLSDWSMVLDTNSSSGATRLSIRATYAGTIKRDWASLAVTDGVSFSIGYPIEVGVYGEAPAGVTVKGPIGSEFHLYDDQGEVTSATDDRPGCAKPMVEGSLELLTTKRIKLMADRVSIIGEYSIPTVREGLGEAQCLGGDTMAVDPETGPITVQVVLTPAQWEGALTQEVSYDDTSSDWHVTVGP